VGLNIPAAISLNTCHISEKHLLAQIHLSPYNGFQQGVNPQLLCYKYFTINISPVAVAMQDNIQHIPASATFSLYHFTKSKCGAMQHCHFALEGIIYCNKQWKL
jgi:hypothetical protein